MIRVWRFQVLDEILVGNNTSVRVDLPVSGLLLNSLYPPLYLVPTLNDCSLRRNHVWWWQGKFEGSAGETLRPIISEPCNLAVVGSIRVGIIGVGDGLRERSAFKGIWGFLEKVSLSLSPFTHLSLTSAPNKPNFKSIVTEDNQERRFDRLTQHFVILLLLKQSSQTWINETKQAKCLYRRWCSV